MCEAWELEIGNETIWRGNTVIVRSPTRQLHAIVTGLYQFYPFQNIDMVG